MGLGQQRPPGERQGIGVVADAGGELCRSAGRVRREIGRGCAAQAVAAAHHFGVVLMLGFPVVVCVIARARLGLRGINVQRGMRVATGESERQDQDKAAGEQRSHKTEG